MKSKKLIYIILSIILVFLISVLGVVVFLENNNYKESEQRFEIVCSKDTIKKDETVLCNLNGVFDVYSISGISTNIKLGNDLELIDVKIDKSWYGEGTDGKIDVYSDENKKGNFKIAKFTVKALKDNPKFEISLDESIVADDKFEEFQISNYVLEFGGSHDKK